VRTGDPSAGHFANAASLKKSGAVPKKLDELRGKAPCAQGQKRLVVPQPFSALDQPQVPNDAIGAVTHPGEHESFEAIHHARNAPPRNSVNSRQAFINIQRAAPGFRCAPSGHQLLLLFFLLVTTITPPIAPIHAGNARGRGRVANAGLGIRYGEHRRRNGEGCRNRDSKNAKNTSTRNRFRFQLFSHGDLPSLNSIKLNCRRTRERTRPGCGCARSYHRVSQRRKKILSVSIGSSYQSYHAWQPAGRSPALTACPASSTRPSPSPPPGRRPRDRRS